MGNRFRSLLQTLWANKGLRFLLQLLLFVALAYLLKQQWQRAAAELPPLSWQRFQAEFSLAYFSLALLLLPLNWALEAQKWRALLGTPMAFFRALKAVFMGLALGVFTPNRIGEHAGRLLYLPKELRAQSLSSSAFGSLAQWIVLVAAGLLALVYRESTQLPIPSWLLAQKYWLYGVLPPLLLLLLGLYFFGPQFWSRWTFLQKYTFLKLNLPKRNLTAVLGLSLLRYSCYILQNVALLYAFGARAPFLLSFTGVQLVFLAQTALPIPASLALLARASLSLYFLAPIAADHILWASFTLWLINIFLPTLIASLLSLFSLNAKPKEINK